MRKGQLVTPTCMEREDSQSWSILRRDESRSFDLTVQCREGALCKYSHQAEDLSYCAGERMS
jgi:hypothetical protein